MRVQLKLNGFSSVKREMPLSSYLELNLARLVIFTILDRTADVITIPVHPSFYQTSNIMARPRKPSLFGSTAPMMGAINGQPRNASVSYPVNGNTPPMSNGRRMTSNPVSFRCDIEVLGTSTYANQIADTRISCWQSSYLS